MDPGYGPPPPPASGHPPPPPPFDNDERYVQNYFPPRPNIWSPSLSPLPDFFYRVQHSNQATFQYREGEFVAGSRPPTRYSTKWLTGPALPRHLDWSSRVRSPFISLFDNYEDAVALAKIHVERRDPNVRICKIDTGSLLPDYAIPRADADAGWLPIWLTEPAERGGEGNIFFSTLDARRYLGLSEDAGQESEWFCVESIDSELVVGREVFQ